MFGDDTIDLEFKKAGLTLSLRNPKEWRGCHSLKAKKKNPVLLLSEDFPPVFLTLQGMVLLAMEKSVPALST